MRNLADDNLFGGLRVNSKFRFFPNVEEEMFLVFLLSDDVDRGGTHVTQKSETG